MNNLIESIPSLCYHFFVNSYISNIFVYHNMWGGVTINTKYTKFKIFMFTYWAMMLGIAGMYTMYIAEVGFTKKQISIAVTIFTISTFIGQNFFGYLADRFKCIKKLLILANIVGIIVSIALNFSDETWFIGILIFLWGFFLYGTVPLSDAWYMGVLEANGDGNKFGVIRGMGSIGYGLSGVLMGLLLKHYGWGIYSWYITVSTFITLVIILSIDEDDGGTIIQREDISMREAFEQIIKTKPLRSIVIIVFIYNFVLKGIYSYLGVLVMDFGGGPLSLGLTYFFDATPELITFALTSKLLDRYENRDLIFVAFILQIIRLSLILVFNSPVAIILLGTLSGFAFGLLATAYKTFIYEVAPDKYKVSCLSLSESIIGLSGVISAPVFGFLFVKFDGHMAIGIGLLIYVLIALSLGIRLYGNKKWNKKSA